MAARHNNVLLCFTLIFLKPYTILYYTYSVKIYTKSPDYKKLKIFNFPKLKIHTHIHIVVLVVVVVVVVVVIVSIMSVRFYLLT